jgi:hypothetical protein
MLQKTLVKSGKKVTIGTPIKIADVKITVFDKYTDYLIHEAVKGKTVGCCMPSGYFQCG